jgi:tetratricopeptide (TPR) repeat protein
MPTEDELRRRLDRLRATRGVGGPESPTGLARARLTSPEGSESTAGPSVRRRERAERLAADLGGRVADGPAGPVVWGPERCQPMPLAREALAELPYPLDPRRPLICLDTETTGLGTAAGTLVFLVGIGDWDGIDYRVRQLFLPDQPDEEAFLWALAEAIPPDAWLVTYNGRSFDWPLIVARYRLRQRAAPVHAGHLDLLPVARQLWRHRLPDARLASVESGIAGVRRRGDLPGALIPGRYLDYLRTGRGGLLREVAEHNMQDVLSLARLLLELSRGLASADGRRAAHPGDVAALGHAYARRGRLREGLECLETALERLGDGPSWGPEADRADLLSAERARILARLGHSREAAVTWLRIADRGGPLAVSAWLKVARHREHVERAYVEALAAAERAAAIAERARLLGRPMTAVEADLTRRLPRLRRRVARQRREAASLSSPMTLRTGMLRPAAA